MCQSHQRELYKEQQTLPKGDRPHHKFRTSGARRLFEHTMNSRKNQPAVESCSTAHEGTSRTSLSTTPRHLHRGQGRKATALPRGTVTVLSLKTATTPQQEIATAPQQGNLPFAEDLAAPFSQKHTKQKLGRQW